MMADSAAPGLNASSPLRFGILGAARIVPNALIKPARAMPEIEIAAIAARDPQRAQRFAQQHAIPVVHSSYAALIADPSLDAIYNPLPNHLHAQWTIAALQAGKHVLCEKPFAANAHEAAAMVAAAQACGKILMEAFHYRYHPAFLRMQELVAGGELGKLQHLEVHFCTPLLRLNDIRYRFELAGGATMDLGCYCIHMLRTLAAAEPVVLAAQARTLRPHVDRRMDADLIFPASPHNPTTAVTARFVCSFFSSTLLRIILVARCEQGEARLLNPVLPQLFHRLRVRRGKHWQSEHFPGEASYTYQLRAFLKSVQTGQPPLTDAADGLANMRTIDAVYRATGLPLRGNHS
jgi:predicted dehydrogenase